MFRTTIAAIALSLPAGALAQDADLDEMELVVRAGEPIEVTINDQPVRFVIAPDAISVPTVNADTGTRLGLERSMIGYIYLVGSTRLPFSTDTVRYTMQDGSFRRRTSFGQMQVIEGVDGIAGPDSFPQRRVVLTMRDGTAEDRPISYPLDRMGRSQTGTLIEIGGVPIHVAFSFARGESLVSATGGRIIADDRGGYFDGEPREIPILYMVNRPVRPLALRDPLMLGELEVRNLAVRVSDFGSSRGIDEAAPEAGDPEEIVVTANSGDMPRQRLLVGMDTIGHCASITYDFEAETVTLMCPPQPEARSVPAG